MGIYNAKYATSEQIATIERLAADGHEDALIAFGKECVYASNKSLTRNCLIAFGIGMAIAAADSAIRTIKRKRTEKKLKETKVILDSMLNTTEEEGS